MKATTEAAFETLIEEHLLANGYVSRKPATCDIDRALITADFLGYIEETQPKVWAKQKAIHGDALGKNILDAFDKVTTQQGVLHVVRRGFRFYGSDIQVAAFAPSHGLNPDVEKAYAANRLAVVRQVHFDPKQPGLSLDLVLFLNGIPVVTAELKNAMTSQYASDAVAQYKTDRDPQAPIFRFKRRALVHFAVGSDEVYMTTRLAGEATRFLPFNRGAGTGKGNPPIEGKYRTSYLWEHVWARDSLMDLLARFIHLQVDEVKQTDGSSRRRETMIFPRYHQRDCVRKLIAAARDKGAGNNYLVQHSAGSGKSNSIAWLAHRLASLHDAADEKVYHSVVVITDRVVLDRQLQETIYQFDHKPGVVQKIDKRSDQLAVALEQGVPIIITTLHKFGFIADKIEALPERRYAVIVDEAHSSQSGEMARNMKEILGAGSIAKKLGEEDTDDLTIPEQAALRAALSRGPQGNLSYFAFTATPKFKTLELFGHKGDGGQPAPFHLYSMRQAIEEEFILDVLKGYTTYKRYFKLVKQIVDDPELDKRKAAGALARFVSLHPTNIGQKTEVIIEHFRSCVRPKMGGRAKGMVVTESRLAAVRYKQAFDRYLAEKGYDDIGVLVAFSGEVADPDIDATHTEPGMNDGVKETELPEVFGGPDYSVLIVAEKYQTGFDQPLLVAMYVDKRLGGIQAVQTLSRLNRKPDGKEGVFVLDFVNEREQILASFQQYYEGTEVAESVDPQRLYELQNELDGADIYHRVEIEQFAAVFFKKNPRPEDNAKLNALLDPARDRFGATDDEQAEAFRGRLQAYLNLYSFLAQVVPFSDVELEKLYAFARMLIRKLPRKDASPTIDLGGDVALHYYRLEKAAEGRLGLVAEGTQPLTGPTATGTGQAESPHEKLSHLIELMNERFGTEFDAQDFIDGVTAQLVADETLQQAALVNDKANFGVVFNEALDDAIFERHAKHGQFIDGVYGDDENREFFQRTMLDSIHKRLTERRESA